MCLVRGPPQGSIGAWPTAITCIESGIVTSPVEAEQFLSVGCSRCLMSPQNDPNLHLKGLLCIYCRNFEANFSIRVQAQKFDEIIWKIKQRGRGRAYDCILGVSGGVDSSFLLATLAENDVRVLAVHVDNGWNSNLAVANIQKLLVASGFDLYTVVLELKHFYDLQRAFLLASVPDLEIPTDHAIQASLWAVAEKFDVPTIVSGMNFATESSANENWAYGHSDWTYISAIWERFGNPEADSFPHFTLKDLGRLTVKNRLLSIALLNYMDYKKADAIAVLQDKFDWEPYGNKHFESVYTRWVQGYLLPTKFQIDKRTMHLSDLVRSGQLERSLALAELEKEYYPHVQRASDQKLILKKLSLTDSELQDVLGAPPRTFRDFPNSYHLARIFRGTLNFSRRLRLYPK